MSPTPTFSSHAKRYHRATNAEVATTVSEFHLRVDGRSGPGSEKHRRAVQASARHVLWRHGPSRERATLGERQSWRIHTWKDLRNDLFQVFLAASAISSGAWCVALALLSSGMRSNNRETSSSRITNDAHYSAPTARQVHNQRALRQQFDGRSRSRGIRHAVAHSCIVNFSFDSRARFRPGRSVTHCC
jgi:hypothetical protein